MRVASLRRLRCRRARLGAPDQEAVCGDVEVGDLVFEVAAADSDGPALGDRVADLREDRLLSVLVEFGEGRVQFEGMITELLAAKDPFLERFLLMTLPPW